MDNRWTSIVTDFDAFGTCTYWVLCFIRGQDNPIETQKFGELTEARQFIRRWVNNVK